MLHNGNSERKNTARKGDRRCCDSDFRVIATL